MEKGAFISECGKYRYWLYRSWDNKKKSCLFIMLNPSTADGEVDDPTIKKCISYAENFGYGSLYVVNLFAYRATDKNKLKIVDNPVGKDNDRFIDEMSRKADLIIAAWGNDGSYLNRSWEVLSKLSSNSRKIYCLKLSKNNEPCHPLYLRKDSPLVELA